ncbi:LemA family protein [Thalassorhabdus alkalitolerans]|uniref:LemA family protein n=1 Tax=Thalassorhabdus alkalitolerans TaxID=2282697 RepID=A0ABW0YMD1_9BACI|nr:LemA family protein [Thalassobacillus sp. C254]
MTFAIILGVILVVSIISWIIGYNSLIKCLNWVEESWAQIDVQLKRRYELIPTLVETVKGYAAHEKETLEKVIELRNQITAPSNDRAEQMEANDQLSGMLENLFALGEDYPELKANENFKALQEELIQTENKIADARQLYNDTVKKYNSRIQSIPTNFVANIHNFNRRDFLETPAAEQENVQVSF